MKNKCEGKVKVLTIAAVCEIFNCNRQYYYTNIRHRLEAYPTVERRVYYKLDEVNALLEKFNTEKSRDFEVIK